MEQAGCRCDVADDIVKIFIIPKPGDPGGIRWVRIRQSRQRQHQRHEDKGQDGWGKAGAHCFSRIAFGGSDVKRSFYTPAIIEVDSQRE